MDGDTWRRSDEVLHRVRERLDELDSAHHEQDAVLVTLVDVEGSAYRRPGAKRLLEPGHEDAGTVVPGCLDARLERLADSVREDGDARTATFDLSDGDIWDLGVGCDGVVTLLVEPLDSSLAPALDALDEDRATAIGTVLDSETSDLATGDRATFETTGDLIEDDWPSWLVERVSEVVVGADDRTAEVVTVDGSGGTADVFLDWVVSSPRLVVFGTGPDVDPLVEAARLAGFSPTVVGFRGAVGGDRFPAATEFVSTRPADVREAIALDADTAAVVATHNFVDDRLAVDQLLETAVPYIGVVGSRERFERLRDQLETDSGEVDRLYGPAGLDLGGETPEQIALSVVSEALAVCNGRTPDHLRERSGPIHERSSSNS